MKAEIAVRQIVAFLAGGLMVAAGAYSTANAISGLAPAHIVFVAIMAVGVGFVVAGIVQWHRKVYC